MTADQEYKKAEALYIKHFNALPVMEHYATGDLSRDAKIIRECVRLNTPIKHLPCDWDEGDLHIEEEERARLHALVPA